MQDWLAGLGGPAELAIRCAINALIGGAFGFYIRELYKRWGSSVSDRESFGNLFPVLTAITVVIIFVVKSSLALSLGLVGALSIVRFRTAIKNPEELISLFFCIGLGVALGAELRLLTLLSVIVISAFIVGRGWLKTKPARHDLLLTVSGEADSFLNVKEAGVASVIGEFAERWDVQRLDLEDGRVQLRATVSLKTPDDATALVSQILAKLPGSHVSYVNLDSLT